MMNRSVFITSLAAGALLASRSTGGQQAKGMRRIGWL
jgi:hypothetical protein